MARVFISHSSRDNESAARIKTWLAEQGFETPFLDYDKHAGIPPGADWEKTLYQEIELSEAVVIIQTPNWLDSKWCFAEFTQARALGKSIFPIIETPTGDTLISSDIQALDLHKDREGGLEQLSSQLTQIALDAQGGFGWDASRPPYPGLLAFQEEDAALYFGRDDDIRRLIERLDARRAQGGSKLIALLGSSGSGKSSLLRAGVIPRLKRAGRNWIVLPAMRPQVRPVDELARCLAVAYGADADWRRLREELNSDNLAQSLSDIANDLRMRARANEAQILLPIDQGEELFGAADPDQARRFCEILNVALSSDLPFIAVIAMRSDYLGLLQSAEHLNARFEEFSLGPLPLARIALIIEGPARVAGLGIDEAFVHQAVKDAKTEDALPLLAFALRELYDSATTDNYLSLAEYNALGDAKEGLTPLENAVRKAADNVLAEARPSGEELTALREAFVPAMVRVNDQGEYVRQPARWDDLPTKAHALLERLTKARLLIVSMDGEERMVEVAHEAMLRKWPRLRTWLDDAREFLAGKQQLQQDLHDWEQATDEDKTGALLSGLKLNRAHGWFLERPHQLSAEERALIKDSIDHAEAEEKSRQAEQARRLSDAEALAEANNKTAKRTRIGLVIAVILALIAGGAGLYAQNQTNEATKRFVQATGLRLSSDAQGIFSLPATDNIGSAYQQLLAAYRLAPGGSTESVLLDRLVRDADLKKLIVVGEPVLAVAFSPNGKLIVSGSRDGTLRLWDAHTGQSIGTVLKGHMRRVSSVAFSPDSHRIVSGSWDATLRLWDADTGKPIGSPLTGHLKMVTSVAFSPDGHRIVSGSWDTTLRQWDAETGKPIGSPLMGHREMVRSVAFSPDGQRIVSGSWDTALRLWDANTGLPIGSPLKGHSEMVTSVAFSPDGHRIISGSDDKTLRRWNAHTQQPIGAPLQGHREMVKSVAFSPDGQRIVSGSWDTTLRLWDADTGKPIGVPLEGHGRGVLSVAFSPDTDGKHIVSGSMDTTLRLWDANTGQPIGAPLTGHEEMVTSLAFSPDGHRIVSGSWDTTLRQWDAETGKPIGSPLTGHRKVVTSVAFSPDGHRIVSSSSDNTLRLWDAATGKPIGAPIKGHGEIMTSVAFSPDGQRIVSGSDDNTLRLWDAATGQSIGAPLTGHEEMVTSVAFSPDGQRIVSGSDDTTLRLWDVHTQQPIGAPLKGHREMVTSIAFSPDGQRIVSGSDDNTLRLWDTETGKPIGAPLTGHGEMVTSVAFSPDGQRIVSGSDDTTLRFWDADTGKPIGVPLKGHGEIMTSVAFSPNGERIVSGSDIGTLRLWPAPKAWSKKLCNKLTRNMSHKQWFEWISTDIDYKEQCPGLPVPPDVMPGQQ